LYDLIDRESKSRPICAPPRWRGYHQVRHRHSQSERVSQVACHLFKQLRSKLNTQRSGTHLLQAGHQLHEIGSLISLHSDYHKHGAYILTTMRLFSLGAA
jgi:exopolyphosphatase/pppGpp-phosphohydrolase